MGYDMYLVRSSQEEDELYRAAYGRFLDCAARRDALPPGSLDYEAAQLSVEAAYNAADEAHTSYFRLNIWGMARYADAMYRLGMVYISRPPRWPAWPEFDDDQRDQQFTAAYDHLEHDEVLPDDVPADILEAVRAYVEQTTQIRREHPGDGTTIPAHKVDSNDGWVVTPEEIRAALAVHDAHPQRDAVLAAIIGTDKNAIDDWHRWIAYLRRAVDCDGFRVY